MKQRKVLGRGLDALLNPEGISTEGDKILEVDINDIIVNEYQPRTNFEEKTIKQLAESIAESGLLQPITVTKIGTKYEIIAGERRFRAMQLLNKSKVPVLLRNVDNAEKLELALIENIQRENLNPVEEAQAYSNLMQKFGYTQDALAKKLGKERSTIANMLRLLKLPERVRLYLQDGRISVGHAKVLLSLDKEKQILDIAEKIIIKGLNVRQTEKLVASLKQPASSKKRDSSNIFIRDLEEKILKKTGLKNRIKDVKGRGKLELYYNSPAELDALLDRIL